MTIGAHSVIGSVVETPSRGRWRVRLISVALLAALAAGALLYGPGAVEHFLIKTTSDRYSIPGVTQVDRVTRIHRLGDVRHGVQEEWYETGIQKSRTRFLRGERLELVHWSPEGLLDGWWLPSGGVEVTWMQAASYGAEAWKFQTQVGPMTGGERVVVEYRFDAMEHAREETPGSSEGYFTPEEIIEIVRAAHDSAMGSRVEIVEPPIQAPRRVGGAGPEER